MLATETISRPVHIVLCGPRVRLVIIGVTAAFICGTVAARIMSHAFRQRTAIREIEHYNGSVHFHSQQSRRFRRWTGEEGYKWFGKPWHVVFMPDEETLGRRSRFGGLIRQFEGPTIDDTHLACLDGLPKLKSLDLAFSNITDAALEHITRLKYLEELRFEGCDITDRSIPILSGMRSLKELSVIDTKITVPGSRALAAALPSCEVQGPHNDRWLLRELEEEEILREVEALREARERSGGMSPEGLDPIREE